MALAAVGDGPPGAHADARLRPTTMRLTVSGLPRVGAGGFYEVWMMRDAGHLVALGSFRVGADGRARVDLPVTASPRRFPVLDISRSRPTAIRRTRGTRCCARGRSIAERAII